MEMSNRKWMRSPISQANVTMSTCLRIFFTLHGDATSSRLARCIVRSSFSVYSRHLFVSSPFPPTPLTLDIYCCLLFCRYYAFWRRDSLRNSVLRSKKVVIAGQKSTVRNVGIRRRLVDYFADEIVFT